MSLMDVRSRRRATGPEGLSPPPVHPGVLLADLRWHARLYKLDGLDRPTRWTFLALRVVQRLAYNVGWYRGSGR